MMNNKINVNTDKEKVSSHSSTDTVTSFLDSNNPALLTNAQKAELDALSNLPDEAVRKEAESDLDCEPLK